MTVRDGGRCDDSGGEGWRGGGSEGGGVMTVCDEWGGG